MPDIETIYQTLCVVSVDGLQTITFENVGSFLTVQTFKRMVSIRVRRDVGEVELIAFGKMLEDCE